MAREYAAQAVKALRRVLNDATAVQTIKSDPMLNPLRSYEDFKNLLQEVERVEPKKGSPRAKAGQPGRS